MAKLKRTKEPAIKPAPPSAPVAPAGDPVTARTDAHERHHRISVAAYYRAERRGFTPGADQQDWFEAEKEIEPRA